MSNRPLFVEPLELRNMLSLTIGRVTAFNGDSIGLVGNGSGFVADGNVAVFTGYLPGNGLELFRSDGTSAGTTLIKDIASGTNSSFPQALANVNGTVFFNADDGVHGHELWKTDGTSAGTVLVRDISIGKYSSSPTSLTNVNGRLFFIADDGVHGPELWESNGTSAGTILVRDIVPNQAAGVSNLTNFNGTLFFSADDGTHGPELWKCNGTSAGTVMVRDIAPGAPQSAPRDLTVVGNTLFFTATDDTIRGLWKSNGTSAGTVAVRDFGMVGATLPQNLTNVAGMLFFHAVDSAHADELWKSDGTSAGTVLVKDIQPGANLSSGPVGLTNINGTLFFAAHDASYNLNQLWRSNGTSAGTTLVRQFTKDVGQLTAVGATVQFMANDGVHGSELWSSNGTSAGTFLVRDLNPGSAGSYGEYLTAVGGRVFFRGTSNSTTSDLFSSVRTNQAPVLNTAASPTLVNVAKNAGLPVGKVGTLVDALVHLNGSLKNVTDTEADALTGIAVTRVDTTHGTWYYSLNNGATWQALTASTTSAKLLAANGQTRLYFRPTAGFTGPVATAISFRAWDQTSGINGGTLDVSTFAATSSFSRYGDTASITVV